jgi:hypothetical protein
MLHFNSVISPTWGYWSYPPDQPYVDADWWVARRRMTGVCERWAQDKTDNIHRCCTSTLLSLPMRRWRSFRLYILMYVNVTLFYFSCWLSWR